MNDDDTAAAWHQLELENWQWLLSHDPAYALWLEQLELIHRQEKEQIWQLSTISISTP